MPDKITVKSPRSALWFGRTVSAQRELHGVVAARGDSAVDLRQQLLLAAQALHVHLHDALAMELCTAAGLQQLKDRDKSVDLRSTHECVILMSRARANDSARHSPPTAAHTSRGKAFLILILSHICIQIVLTIHAGLCQFDRQKTPPIEQHSNRTLTARKHVTCVPYLGSRFYSISH